MNAEKVVNFETYYFLELLDRIREEGNACLPGKQKILLNQFIEQLSGETDAQKAIEHLAKKLITGDLSIFFSDILEHLHRMTPAESFEKLDQCTEDFLEMFRVISQEEEWETVAPGESSDERENISIREFCLRELQTKLAGSSDAGSGDKEDKKFRVLKSLLMDVDYRTRLFAEAPDEQIQVLLNWAEFVIPEKTSTSNMLQFIDNFNEKSSEFISTFNKIYAEHSASLLEILEGKAVKTEPAGKEIPLEEMFESPPETPEATAEEGTHPADVAILASELAKKEARPAKMTEEQKDRRRFLRDYVLGEIEAFSTELSEYLRSLIQNPGDNQLWEQFEESLKALKDLGQIHSYPGIESLGVNLLQLFNTRIRQKSGLPAGIDVVVEEIFSLLPTYVDANLSGHDARALSDVANQIERLKNLLSGKEATFSLKEREPVLTAYQEIVLRSVSLIREKLFGTASQQNSTETVREELKNLQYWSILLNIPGGSVSVDCVQNILSSPEFDATDESVRDRLTETLDFWEKKFTTAPEAEWRSINRVLANLLSAEPAVPVADAGKAYQEVCLRLIAEFNEKYLSEELSPEIWKKLKAILLQLKENSVLAGNEEFAHFCRSCQKNLEAFDPADLQLSASLKSAMTIFLGRMKVYFDDFPAALNFPVLESAFDEMIAESAAPPPAEVPEGEQKGGDERRESVEPVTDEEILQVFKVEGAKYIQQITDQLRVLEKNIGDEDAWKRIGIAVHTLNGSAKMIGYNEMVELATPMEECAEMIKESRIPKETGLIPIFKNITQIMAKRITDAQASPGDTLVRLREFMDEYLVKGTPAVEESAAETLLRDISAESVEPPAVQEVEAETPGAMDDILHLKEQDPELLGIFQEEVSASYDVIERNLANLEKFIYDKAAWKEIEQAVHEIHGAAKMLGLAEIGSLAQEMETLSEAMVAQKPVDSDLAIPLMRRSMHVVRELTSSHQISRDEYRQALQSLESILELENEIESLEQRSAAEVTPEVKQVSPVEEIQPAPQLMEAFLQESRELLDDMNYLLLKLEKDPENAEMKHHLMRSVHTLKGSAGMVYASHIEKLGHLCEDITEYYVQAGTALPEDYFDLMLSVADEFSFCLEALETEGSERTRNFDELMSKLAEYMRRISLEVPEGIVSQPETPAGGKPEKTAPEVEPEPISREIPKDPYIRLKIGQMNRLLNLAAELVIGHTQFKDQLDRLKHLVPSLDSELNIFREIETHLNSILDENREIQENLSKKSETDPGITESFKTQLEKIERIIKNVQALHNGFSSSSFELKDNSKNYDENLQKLNKISNELLDEIMQARLVPINLLFQRFQRPIRDLARSFGKKIDLQISGENTELDRTLIDELYQPLIHIIRNAIDHGLETPEVRRAAGKPETGRLEIKASRDRNQVIIEVKDDGAGVDKERVRKKVVEEGLITAEAAEKLSDEEIFKFLFHPGFTTTSEATLVSGRGVGMDAVKTQIEKIKGDVRISTEEGQGTTVTLRVPISLSVVQSMLVDVGGHNYSIPLNQVEENLNVKVKDFVNEGGVYYLPYRGERIAVVQLSQLLIVRDARPRPISVAGVYPVIVVQAKGQRIGLLVDHIVRREEILIKSLGPSMRRLKFIAGGCIMADGQVVLVLDIPEVIQESLKLSTRGEGTRPPISFSKENAAKEKSQARRRKKVIEGRKPRVLIVDDSLSIRKYLSGLLMQKGYITETARNGYDALELLNTREFDLMVTDLEMPKLSGYELIENVRREERFADFPIIVLTGRANENIRRLTEDLGADAYIIKPFKDRELFESIQTYIEYHF